MSDDYERTWPVSTPSSETMILCRLTTEKDIPVRFLVQLQYRDPNGNHWLPIARFDHDLDGPAYRNVAIVGSHMDVLDPDGVQRFKKTDFPPVPLEYAMRAAEAYLQEEHEQLVLRFERWM